MTERKRSLVPDPIFGLLDIQKVDTVEEDDELSLTYETAEEEIVPLKVVEFYDPNFGHTQEDTILSIYDGPRYGKLTIKELKKMCKDRELPLSGNKKALIDRLDKHNEEQKKIITNRKSN